MIDRSAFHFAALVFVFLFALSALADCLPCKEEIDNGMGVEGATLYARTIASVPNIRQVDREAPVFYVRVVERILSPLAKEFLAGDHGQLTKAQTETLMEQIDKQCYRALDLRAWALKTDSQVADNAIVWTAKIFAWADDDQKVYTKLAAELKD